MTSPFALLMARTASVAFERLSNATATRADGTTLRVMLDMQGVSVFDHAGAADAIQITYLTAEAPDLAADELLTFEPDVFEFEDREFWAGEFAVRDEPKRLDTMTSMVPLARV